uniref:Putative colicin like protein n=1 Tax=Xenorhabdus nematophila TaxID=628 RepID=A6XA70_XENNE|nr:putative colicin like protein [Xenorhabdus nematophila]
MCPIYGDGTDWSSEKGGYYEKPGDDDRHKNDGNKDRNDSGSSSGGSSSVDLSQYPEAMAIIFPYFAAVPSPIFPINGVLGVTINTGFIDTGLINLGNFINKAKPMANRLAQQAAANISGIARVGVFANPIVGIGIGSLWPGSIATDQEVRDALEKKLKENGGIIKLEHGYIVSTLPVDQVSSVPAKKIRENKKIVAETVVTPVIDEKEQKRKAAITKSRTQIPVIKAEPTNRPNVYSASVVPGMKPMQIKVDNTNQAVPKNISKANPIPNVEIFTSAPVNDTHHAFIDFGEKHDLIYISVSKIPTVAEEKEQIEESKKNKQKWLDNHPLIKAEIELAQAQKELEEVEKLFEEKRDVLNKFLNTSLGRLLISSDNFPYNYHIIENDHSISNGTSHNEISTVSIKNKEDLDNLLKHGGKYFSGSTTTEALYNKLRQELLDTKNEIDNAKNELNIVMENRKKAEDKKKAKEQKAEQEQELKRKGVQQNGHKYHPAPETEDIKGLGDLEEAAAKTPKQGGGGKRARWFGDKRRKIYEWDSQHGELEGYRASDGQHLGSFDPKTGRQLKSADPKRNIKKYL